MIECQMLKTNVLAVLRCIRHTYIQFSGPVLSSYPMGTTQYTSLLHFLRFTMIWMLPSCQCVSLYNLFVVVFMKLMANIQLVLVCIIRLIKLLSSIPFSINFLHRNSYTNKNGIYKDIRISIQIIMLMINPL